MSEENALENLKESVDKHLEEEKKSGPPAHMMNMYKKLYLKLLRTIKPPKQKGQKNEAPKERQPIPCGFCQKPILAAPGQHVMAHKECKRLWKKHNKKNKLPKPTCYRISPNTAPSPAPLKKLQESFDVPTMQSGTTSDL